MNFYTVIDSPLGELLLISDGKSLCGLYMEKAVDPPALNTMEKANQLPVFEETITQMQEYFAGKRTKFDLPIELNGSDFQKKVWQELCKIPYGKTVSYAAIARSISSPSASRAVGLANGRNPISIIVPCHRVIGSNGSLTGYAGGIDRKRNLLDHESGRCLLLRTIQCKSAP